MLFFKIYTSIKLQLHPDEAYYWLWSQHLDLSYYDHPPMVAYFIKLTTLFSNSEFFVRLSSLICLLIVIYLIWKLTKEIFSPRTALLSVLIFVLYPFNIVSFMITPDIPLILFWTMTVYFLYKSIKTGEMQYWILAGITTGLTLLSKYSAILLIIGLFIFLLTTKEYRIILKKPYLYLFFIIAFIVFSPVIFWNYKHNWVSFIYQFNNGISDITSYDFRNVFIFLSGQILTGGITFSIIGLILGTINLFNKDNTMRFLSLFAILPFIFFTVSSIHKLAEANWALPGFICMTLIISDYFIKNKTRIKNVLLGTSLGFCFILSIIMYSHALFRIIPVEKINRVWVLTDPTNWFYGWKEFANYIKPYQNIPVLPINIQLASELNYYWNKNGIIVSNDQEFKYLKFNELNKSNDCIAINYSSDVSTPKPDKNKFKEMKLQEIVKVKRGNHIIRNFYIYKCKT